jgi:alanyl-tRNA synthetase
LTIETTTWTGERLRSLFLDFFKEKGSVELPSSSLVPEDNTVLLTTAGMQQMIPYMLGLREPPRPRLCSVQKCFRTTDIDQVGNPRTLTFFEMLGNFSIGDSSRPRRSPGPGSCSPSDWRCRTRSCG